MSYDDGGNDESEGDWIFPILVLWLWMLLWMWPIAVAMIVIPLLVWLSAGAWDAYTRTETYRFRNARRDIRRIIRWGRRQIGKM